MKFNTLIPELSVSNIQNSLNFYTKVLNFKIEYERKEDKFAFLSYGKAQLMIEEINNHWNTGELTYPFGRGVNFQIETTNIQEIQNALKKNNIKPFKDIFESSYRSQNTIYKQQEILILDPDGYLLRFSQDIPTNAKNYLGQSVSVVMDRPLGTKHPKHGFVYPVNYGYIPDTVSGDGEELDAYVLGVDTPLATFTGKCIAIIHRTNDNDDKLVIVPEGMILSDKEIEKQVHFQEQWFKHTLIREAK